MRPSRIFETVLYAEDLAAVEQFYRNAIGLEVIRRGDLAVVFRCGSGVLLIFDPRKSRAAGRGVPSHGTSGIGHIAFATKPEDLVAWRKQLREAGIPIELERIGRKVDVRSIFAILPVMLWRWLLQRCGVVVGSFDCHEPPNQPMKPTAPFRNNSSVFGTTPYRGLSLSR